MQVSVGGLIFFLLPSPRSRSPLWSRGLGDVYKRQAESDAFKRCAMKIGLGLHLWAGEEYYLDKKLNDVKSKKNLKLKSA